jgi:hypothetical protein
LWQTTDAAGEKVVRTAIFTPVSHRQAWPDSLGWLLDRLLTRCSCLHQSFAPTGTPAAVGAGTIQQYKDYTQTVEPAIRSQESALAASVSAGSVKLATSSSPRERAFGFGSALVVVAALGAGGWVLGMF